jgi:hypothetical protein
LICIFARWKCRIHDKSTDFFLYGKASDFFSENSTPFNVSIIKDDTSSINKDGSDTINNDGSDSINNDASDSINKADDSDSINNDASHSSNNREYLYVNCNYRKTMRGLTFSHVFRIRYRRKIVLQ